MNKDQHLKWLEKRGLSPKQIKEKKKKLGKKDIENNLKVNSKYALSNTIPSNGTKSADVSKARFTEKNYAIAPAYNKGAVQVLTKTDLKNGAGRKL